MGKERKPQNEVFAKNFGMYFKRWQAETGGTQDDFAVQVGIADRKSISDYLNAKHKPSEDNLNAICEELGVTVDMLYQSNKQDQYRYDKAFTESLHMRFQKFTNDIGLSNEFMKFLKEFIPDQDFPVYSPIRKTGGLFTEVSFVRPKSAEAFQCDEQNEYQRKREDGKTINLTEFDYLFMKDLQSEVISYIEYLCFKRKKEMEDEVSACMNSITTVEKDGISYMIDRSEEAIKKNDKYLKKWEALTHGKNNQKE